ncbi:hypothetical protein GUITHDRAFT_117104 [Guillardia theta CCMP2712]|uniref:Uncharacterized protein n=1 Tax=Guillardia theta (strain CCMP2712) TaxID=905079 RepID=L1ILA3_GUITC|nr:hypothetical protein GUITHDRAFT_117104 [Guillardia theta CCMP2712]EKX36679.1 hypothetical protein GUITHDRAFT_117104 [Guillardia theta CCMP2712]|mmetsp:Transcript_49911/g.156232  ORF Transcript_49911/g.156232 Transcript_49911/m.156232 type:complete len:81 (+) Transcript_49911:84-326(+)|eukprot:XP_005823659.1 hypothetical protein GUITHDRAFT_117104 [Guillardia theta CCMP2712]
MAEVLLVLGAVHIGALVVAVNAPGADFKWEFPKEEQRVEEEVVREEPTQNRSYFAQTMPVGVQDEPKSVPPSTSMPKIIV